MDAIAAYLGKDRAEVRSTNFIQPDEFPYEHGLVFQDGRPLTYDSGDYPASLEKLKALVGWDEFEDFRAEMAAPGPPGRHRPGLLRRGHRRRPLRGRPRAHRDLRQGQGRDRPHHAGPGPPDRVRADRRRHPRRAVRGRRGHHRRHPQDALRRGHVRLPRRGDERVGDPPRRAARQGEGAADRGRGAGGRPRTTSRSSTGSSRCAAPTPRSTSARSRCCPTRCATPSTRRPRPPPSSPSATPASRRWPRTTSRAWRARTSTRPTRSTFANGMHAVIVETDPDTAEIKILQVRRRARLRPPDQPDDRRGPDPRRRRAGRGRRALRADGLRRVGPAAQRLVHGLPDALRHRGPDDASTSTTSRRRRRSTRSASRAPARRA